MAVDDKIKLDHIDLKILRILQQHGRITNAKLASEVGLSAPPMLERVKKLERSGVICNYVAKLNPAPLQASFLVFAAINLDISALSRVSEFEAQVKKTPEILECHHIAGEIDFLLKIRVKDQEGYTHFVSSNLSQIRGINRIVTWVALSSCKETTEIDVPEENFQMKR